VRSAWGVAAVLAAVFFWCGTATAGRVSREDARAGVLECPNSNYGDERHNPRLVSRPSERDVLLCFISFVSAFDGGRTLDDGTVMYLRVPRWVSQHVALSSRAAEGNRRPSKWFTVPSLHARGIAPLDDSYFFSKSFRASHPNWYERGHLAQKYLGERYGPHGGWYTHSVANAVPQRARFNQQPWLQLECYTGGWANRFQEIWIITGPAFTSGRPRAWLAEPGRPKALPVAIPDALFKVVARRTEQGWTGLAFLYPQEDATYFDKGPWDPAKWLVSLTQVSLLTGIEFFSGAAVAPDKSNSPPALWPLGREDLDPACQKFGRTLP
jgi:DNA/RNA endonuclease G (NUC1)